MNTKQKIENLHRAAFAVEDDIRRGRMTLDCASVDALARRTNRGGFAVILDEGKAEVIPLGETETHVRKPTMQEEDAFAPYQQMAGNVFEGAKNESHAVERNAAGRFTPIHTEGSAERNKRMAGDAAYMARMSRDAKRDYQESRARNERIAVSMKERSKEIWKHRSA